MNKKVWELYRSSERGKKSVELFTVESEEHEFFWAEKVLKSHIRYFGAVSIDQYDGKEILNYVTHNYWDSLRSILSDNLIADEGEEISKYFERLIDNLEISAVEEDSEGNLYKSEDRLILAHQHDYRTLCSLIPEISLALYTLYTDMFFPILFREHFDEFMKILDVLEIPIPNIPNKGDKRGRLLFYNELNNEILLFAEENGLTLEETCACIYDFAYILLDEETKNDELPAPTNIWLTGGSKGDYKHFLQNPIKGEKSVWTCNENTKRGDIIVMYVLSPHSCIQSIWRADIDGVYTPFNYYNSRTRVTEGILVPEVKIQELKQDNYFSQLPIVRKNFQGVNGVRLSNNDYKELKKLFNKKGFDSSILPNLYNPDLDISITVNNEKEVEENLLIPLLTKLGYEEYDWQRQLTQKTGRSEKVIPDFVFLPKGEMYFQNAPLVIEAKFDMSSNIEQTKAFNQALSYARIMKSTFFAICDKHRFIVYKENKGTFNRFNPVFEKYWQSLNDSDVFAELKTLISKDTISTI